MIDNMVLKNLDNDAATNNLLLAIIAFVVFVLSLDATINMGETKIYLIQVAFFIGALHGISFCDGMSVLTTLLATMCSISFALVFGAIWCCYRPSPAVC